MKDFLEREAEAEAYFASPPKCDLPGQKFPRGSRVKVGDDLPLYMFHFEKGFEGIVQYSYAQKYHGDNIDSYSLIVLNDNGKPVNSISWYTENQLTLISDDVGEGKRIIEEYEFNYISPNRPLK